MKHPFTETELQELVKAIQTAENMSSGEIRVHIDAQNQIDNAKKAWEVFCSLCKDQTKDKNAVLFHLNFEEHYLTIIGDEGIHRLVTQCFWDNLHDEITHAFSQQKYFEGLSNAILKTGRELKKYFPITTKNRNELPDEISFS